MQRTHQARVSTLDLFARLSLESFQASKTSLDFPPHHRARAGAQYNSQLGSIVISESALIATLIAAAVLLTL